ncbi:hypothetical protein BYT27DRAFT_6549674 [Phlegmacium glaucopus]|nr:hypothetical protein BYT27DRAFT_6549674 [Phlegmacium glaucopus]
MIEALFDENIQHPTHVNIYLGFDIVRVLPRRSYSPQLMLVRLPLLRIGPMNWMVTTVSISSSSASSLSSSSSTTPTATTLSTARFPLLPSPTSSTPTTIDTGYKESKSPSGHYNHQLSLRHNNYGLFLLYLLIHQGIAKPIVSPNLASLNGNPSLNPRQRQHSTSNSNLNVTQG